MADGAPNGYSYMTFSQDRYQLDFKVAGRPANYQMNIQVPQEISVNKTDEAEIVVNVFNGSEKSTVEFSLDNDSQWKTLQQMERLDPHYVELVRREQDMTPPVEPKLTRPKISHHLWAGNLPGPLEPGTHLLRVRTTDMHGRAYFGHRSFRVVQ